MYKNDNIFEFYLNNKINADKEKETNIILATLIALSNYITYMDFELSKVIKMIIIENTNTEKLSNQKEIKELLEELHSDQTKESIMAKKCMKQTLLIEKNEDIINKINHLYGRLLLSFGINIECDLKLDFDKLYRKILSITKQDIKQEKEERNKYCYYGYHDVTKEYSHLICILEELMSLKLNEESEFKNSYEQEKSYYRSMPILSSILEKTKKL